ncbi:hypothetical protein ACSMXN_07535 [Jatrophihabitans sp. DSM 45814]
MVARGGALEILTALCILCIPLLRLMPHAVWWYWAGTFAGLGGAALICGVVLGFVGYGKLGKERALGYSTSPQDARKDPSLFLLHPVTLEVMLRPNEPRPERMGKDINVRELLF